MYVPATMNNHGHNVPGRGSLGRTNHSLGLQPNKDQLGLIGWSPNSFGGLEESKDWKSVPPLGDYNVQPDTDQVGAIGWSRDFVRAPVTWKDWNSTPPLGSSNIQPDKNQAGTFRSSSDCFGGPVTSKDRYSIPTLNTSNVGPGRNQAGAIGWSPDVYRSPMMRKDLNFVPPLGGNDLQAIILNGVGPYPKGSNWILDNAFEDMDHVPALGSSYVQPMIPNGVGPGGPYPGGNGNEVLDIASQQNSQPKMIDVRQNIDQERNSVLSAGGFDVQLMISNGVRPYPEGNANRVLDVMEEKGEFGMPDLGLDFNEGLGSFLPEFNQGVDDPYQLNEPLADDIQFNDHLQANQVLQNVALANNVGSSRTGGQEASLVNGMDQLNIGVRNGGSSERSRRLRRKSSDIPSHPSSKRCFHCGSDKTTQWRTGPCGPGTLCNACGLHYKARGCLVDEYRPVTSPHFDLGHGQYSNIQSRINKIRSQSLGNNLN